MLWNFADNMFVTHAIQNIASYKKMHCGKNLEVVVRTTVTEMLVSDCEVNIQGRKELTKPLAVPCHASNNLIKICWYWT